MKIVFLNHFIAGGGAERVTCLLTNNLVNKGYSISMMTDLFKPFAYDVDEKVNKINLFRTKEITRIIKDIIPYCKRLSTMELLYMDWAIVLFMSGRQR